MIQELLGFVGTVMLVWGVQFAWYIRSKSMPQTVFYVCLCLASLCIYIGARLMGLL